MSKEEFLAIAGAGYERGRYAMTKHMNLSELEAQFLKEGLLLACMLMKSRLEEDPRSNPDEEFVCKKCGHKLRIPKDKRAQRRALTTILGEIEYSRPYGRCDQCGYTGAPLDEGLGIPHKGASIAARQRICHAAVVGRSFEDGREVLEVHSGIQFSKKHVRSIAEEEGGRIAEEKVKETKLYQEHKLEVTSQEAPELIVVTCDGGRVQSRKNFKKKGEKDKSPEDKEAGNEDDRKKKDRWKEDKIGVVYDAVARRDPNAAYGEYEGAQAQIKTYCATMEPWEKMGWMLRLEAERRGYKNAKERLFLADGAKHIRDVKNLQFSEATFILDWAHSTEHVSNSAKAAFGEGTKEAHDWYRRHKLMLWNGQRDKLIANLQELSQHLGPPRDGDPDSHPRKTVHRDAFSYFPDNYEAINYPAFRRNGWPIGSGVAEGAVKQFALRMKGSEKFWHVKDTGKGAEPSSVARTGAEEMLSLCALYHCEDGRWDEYWRRRAKPVKRE